MDDQYRIMFGSGIFGIFLMDDHFTYFEVLCLDQVFLEFFLEHGSYTYFEVLYLVQVFLDFF